MENKLILKINDEISRKKNLINFFKRLQKKPERTQEMIDSLTKDISELERQRVCINKCMNTANCSSLTGCIN